MDEIAFVCNIVATLTIFMSENQRLEEVIYFLIDRTIRKSRLYSQHRINEGGFDVTLEQWVVIKKVHETPGINQRELAGSLYKDAPTLTRMLDLIVKKGYLERRRSEQDRRAFAIYLTVKGQQLVKELGPIVYDIRSKGLEGVDAEDLEATKRVLGQIYNNHDW